MEELHSEIMTAHNSTAVWHIEQLITKGMGLRRISSYKALIKFLKPRAVGQSSLDTLDKAWLEYNSHSRAYLECMIQGACSLPGIEGATLVQAMADMIPKIHAAPQLLPWIDLPIHKSIEILPSNNDVGLPGEPYHTEVWLSPWVHQHLIRLQRHLRCLQRVLQQILGKISILLQLQKPAPLAKWTKERAVQKSLLLPKRKLQMQSLQQLPKSRTQAMLSKLMFTPQRELISRV